MKAKNFVTRLFLTGLLFLLLNFLIFDAKTQSQTKKLQTVNSPPILLNSSTILEDLEKYKKVNPQISAEELAKFGNKLLLQKGFNYEISFCDVIERKIKTKKAKGISDENGNFSYVSFPYQMTLVNSAKAIFQITAPNDESCCCGYCYTEFPVLNITKNQMTLVSSGKTYSVIRDKDLSVSEEYVLVDEKTLQREIRKWQVPFETYPFGISKDGTKLYIEFDENDILLEISEKGVLRLVPKNEPNILSNGKDLRQTPPPKIGEILNKSGEFGFYSFKTGNKNYIVKFSYPCT